MDFNTRKPKICEFDNKLCLVIQTPIGRYLATATVSLNWIPLSVIIIKAFPAKPNTTFIYEKTKKKHERRDIQEKDRCGT